MAGHIARSLVADAVCDATAESKFVDAETSLKQKFHASELSRNEKLIEETSQRRMEIVIPGKIKSDG